MARNFPGSSTTDHLKTAGSSVFNFNTNVCWWAVVKVTVLPASFSVIAGAGVAHSRGTALLLLSSGKIVFDKTGIGWIDYPDNPVLSTGIWYAVQAYSTSGGHVKYRRYTYTDQSLVESLAGDTAIIKTASNDGLYVGNLDTPISVNCFNGVIDRVALVQADPSTAEFLAWAKTGRIPSALSAKFYAVLWDASPTGDLSSNRNNLTVTGTTLANGAPLGRFTTLASSSVVDLDIAAPQVARPTTDTTRVGWEELDGNTAQLFAHLREDVPDDTTYIRTGTAPSTAIYVTKLSPLTDPLAGGGHVLRYRIGRDATGEAQVDLTVQLRQDYVDEVGGGLGSLIAEWTHADVQDGWTLAEQPLTAGQADAVSDYSNLFVRLIATTP